ncbi:hypothetical protein H2198_010312 [Neophaeococcomyces mojaviensis]|uniref:Uncharacterized protein n=1 Tax=Neophaeococcomyces mojaviensis TaxID=3383035 RepID=A0ACC2ZRZ4_9EURO|nr:hypothetical protein H2198_010312 [Knufia sp. JES_112]
MDFAYDHIQEHTYSSDRSTTPKPTDSSTSNPDGTDPDTPTQPTQPQRQNLQTEFQETFRAFSNTPWGTKLGGWWSTARTQGASYYETARKEAERREAEAARAFEEARKVVVEKTKTVVEGVEEQLDSIVNEERRVEVQQEQVKEADGSTREANAETEEDTETFLNRFKAEAAKRLKEVQQAEDAADEALLRFGTNIRNFLKDTISITAPDPSADSKSSEVLFESKDATTGKRVIHTSRFDAQLHVIHTTLTSFTTDPTGSGEEWEDWKEGFDVEEKTDDISRDLEKYPELRVAMEKVMGEGVGYKEFWTRYYFMRHIVEMQEVKRRELLQGKQQPRMLGQAFTDILSASTAANEEVGWDEDSDDEADEKKAASKSSTPQINEPATAPEPAAVQTASAHNRTDSDAMTLRPSRRSHDEKSVADSEASYDLVSGAASHANSSPKEKPLKEESDEDDWE